MVAAGLPSLGRIGMTSRPVGALAAVILCLAALPAVAAELVIKRVVLSAGGVAYVEREAEVDGNAELALDLPLDQVDDVLKSVVVYDSSGGLGSAHLPGREPVAQIFADLPFGAEALSSPVALLNALQGAEIRIGGSHPVTGRLLKVVPETARLGDQTIVERNNLSVLTAIGLQQWCWRRPTASPSPMPICRPRSSVRSMPSPSTAPRIGVASC
jgi:hypothetical protein